MTYQGTLTRTDFEHALTPQAVRVTQLIQAALTVGPLAFLGVVLIMYAQRQGLQTAEPDESGMQMLTLVQCFYLVAAGAISGLLRARMFSPKMLESSLPVTESWAVAERCVAQQRTAIIVGLALLEGAAFFGLVVCLMGVMNDVLRVSPFYWVNLISVFVLLVFSVMTFPTRESLVAWFEKAFLEQ